MARLRKLLDHPTVNLGIAVILVLTSLAEGWETIIDDLIELDAKVHHGVLVFGFFQLLRALTDMFEGAKKIAKTDD